MIDTTRVKAYPILSHVEVCVQDVDRRVEYNHKLQIRKRRWLRLIPYGVKRPHSYSAELPMLIQQPRPGLVRLQRLDKTGTASEDATACRAAARGKSVSLLALRNTASIAVYRLDTMSFQLQLREATSRGDTPTAACCKGPMSRPFLV